MDFFHRNATNHVHGDKNLPYQLFDPASHDYRCVWRGCLFACMVGAGAGADGAGLSRRPLTHSPTHPPHHTTQHRLVLPAGAARLLARAGGLGHRREAQGPHPRGGRGLAGSWSGRRRLQRLAATPIRGAAPAPPSVAGVLRAAARARGGGVRGGGARDGHVHGPERRGHAAAHRLPA